MTDQTPAPVAPAYAGPRRILSGIQASGALHLGNYLGALKRFTELQETGAPLFVFVADHTAGSAGREDLPVANYHIPLFIYAGSLMSESGIAKYLLEFVDVFVGRIRGQTAPYIFAVSRVEVRDDEVRRAEGVLLHQYDGDLSGRADVGDHVEHFIDDHGRQA